MASELFGAQALGQERSCRAALHTDGLAVTAGPARRQLFIKPLKEHNQVICVAFCFRLLFFSFCSGLFFFGCSSSSGERERERS